jgi:site-specific DNA-methyltransferase (adenine-specific)
MPNIDLINGECMEYMATLKDKAFELAIVDPPYGIGCGVTSMSNRCSNSIKFKNYKGKQFTGSFEDKKPEDKKYFMELKRVSRQQIIWGANHFIENIPNANSSSWVVWYKNGQNPNSTNADCEIAWTSHKTAIRFFNYDWSGFGFINKKEIKIHPTQKPVALYQWLLKNYAKTGDKILDTHLGSGSSAIAADIMGFDFVGYEIDKDYYKAALDRFNRHKQQCVLEFA